jgi:hypothetical protein
MSLRSGSTLLIVAFVLFLSATAKAEMFTAYLTPAQEVPPAAGSTARGWARVLVNEATGQLTFTVFFEGLTSTQTASHIHAPAAIGVTVGVAINFGAVGGTSGTITGTTTITPTQLSQLRQHLGYVNVHSTNFVNGEIRGQLGPARPVDYDGDGRTDASVLRFPDIAPPGNSPIAWWNLNSFTGPQDIEPFGNANTDFPVPGDFDGDGKGDIAVYRAGATAVDNSFWWILRSSDNTVLAMAFGLGGDEAVQRDYDGDGTTDMAVFRPGPTATSQTVWWIRRSSNPANFLVVGFGLTGNGSTSADFPIPGDYDGDGKFDIAVYRFGQAPTNNFIILQSSDLTVRWQQWGNFTSDYVLPGDYDGDGKYDLAVARTGATSTSPLVWWILQSSTGTARVQTFGRTSDLPAQGDYDGDARTDLAIYRPGATDTSASSYWIYNSLTASTSTFNWGVGADFPVNTFDIR